MKRKISIKRWSIVRKIRFIRLSLLNYTSVVHFKSEKVHYIILILDNIKKTKYLGLPGIQHGN